MLLGNREFYMAGVKGRNGEVAEDKPGNEGQGQRKGLITQRIEGETS